MYVIDLQPGYLINLHGLKRKFVWLCSHYFYPPEPPSWRYFEGIYQAPKRSSFEDCLGGQVVRIPFHDTRWMSGSSHSRLLLLLLLLPKCICFFLVFLYTQFGLTNQYFYVACGSQSEQLSKPSKSINIFPSYMEEIKGFEKMNPLWSKDILRLPGSAFAFSALKTDPQQNFQGCYQSVFIVSSPDYQEHSTRHFIYRQWVSSTFPDRNQEDDSSMFCSIHLRLPWYTSTSPRQSSSSTATTSTL